jgi:hypothetical protein
MPHLCFASSTVTPCSRAYRQTFWHSLFRSSPPLQTNCFDVPGSRLIGLPQTSQWIGGREEEDAMLGRVPTFHRYTTEPLTLTLTRRPARTAAERIDERMPLGTWPL